MRVNPEFTILVPSVRMPQGGGKPTGIFSEVATLKTEVKDWQDKAKQGVGLFSAALLTRLGINKIPVDLLTIFYKPLELLAGFGLLIMGLSYYYGKKAENKLTVIR